MAESTYIAVDLGASNGRVVVARLDAGRLTMEEVHRFPNRPVNVRGEMYWDLLYLYSSMLEGLGAAARSCKGRADGIGCVSWGADYGFLDEAGRLTGHVYSYRDGRTRGMLSALAEQVSFDELFERTGSPFDEMATLCQLFAARRRDPQGPRAADVLLFVCDLMHYFLCGRKAAEYTMATQSQLFNVGENRWDRQLCELVGTLDVMPEVVPPGTILGRLDERIAERCGFAEPPPVIATATHDTAAAAFAAPAK